MKILVVGGFGYLGSIITDLLAHDPLHEVYVYDEKLWDNDLSDDIKFKALHHPDNKYDAVIWCATIDCESFYQSDKTTAFLVHQKDLFRKFVKAPIFINCSSYLLNCRELKLTKRLEFIKDLEIISQEHKHLDYRIPCLYGPSPRMRWDTLVNQIFLNYVSRDELYLDDDILTHIPIAGVLDVAKKIIYLMNNFTSYKDTYKTVHYCSDKYSLLEIGHIIGKMWKPLSYSIKLCTDQFYRSTIDNSCCLDEFKYKLTNAGSDFKTNIERGNLPNYMNDSFNNELFIQNGFTCWNFVKRIGD